VGVITGADEGAGFYVSESHGQGFAFHEGEFFGSVVAGDGEMILRRAEVLADGEDVDSYAG